MNHNQIRLQYNEFKSILGETEAKRQIAHVSGISVSNLNRILNPPDVQDFIDSIGSIGNFEQMYRGGDFVNTLLIVPSNNSNSKLPLPKLEKSSLGFYQALCKISMYLAFNKIPSNKSQYNELITILKSGCNNPELLNKVIQRLVLAFDPHDRGNPSGENLKHSLIRCYEHEFTSPGDRRFDTDDMILGSKVGKNTAKGKAQAKKFYGDPIWVSENHSPLQILLRDVLPDRINKNKKLLTIRKVFMNVMFEIPECSPELFQTRRTELFARLQELNPSINKSEVNTSNINSAKIPKRCALFELCIPQMVPEFLGECSFTYEAVRRQPKKTSSNNKSPSKKKSPSNNKKNENLKKIIVEYLRHHQTISFTKPNGENTSNFMNTNNDNKVFTEGLNLYIECSPPNNRETRDEIIKRFAQVAEELGIDLSKTLSTYDIKRIIGYETKTINVLQYIIDELGNTNITPQDIRTALKEPNSQRTLNFIRQLPGNTNKNKLLRKLTELKNTPVYTGERKNAIDKLLNNRGNNSGQGNNQEKKNTFKRKVRNMYTLQELSDNQLNRYIELTGPAGVTYRNSQIRNTVTGFLAGGKRKPIKKTSTKKVRKHNGIVQTGPNKGKLKKGYKYSGKKLKNGLREITKKKSTK